MGEILLIRHGETEWSREGRARGDPTCRLSRDGRREAEEAGRALDGRALARVLARPPPASPGRALARLEPRAGLCSPSIPRGLSVLGHEHGQPAPKWNAARPPYTVTSSRTCVRRN